MEAYLIKWKGRQSGPFTEEQLRRMLAEREIKAMHEVQIDGEWKTLRSFLKERDRKAAPDPATASILPPVPAASVSEAAADAETPSSDTVARDAVATDTVATDGVATDGVARDAETAGSGMVTDASQVTTALGKESEEALTASPSRTAENQSKSPPDRPPAPDLLPERGDLLPPAEAGKERSVLVYAGFWNRLLSAIIDLALVVVLPNWILSRLFGFGLHRGEWGKSFDEFLALGALGLVLMILEGILVWIYFAAMESSSLRATVGKRVFGLVVTGEQGERISFQRASVRFFAKFVSALMIAAGFFLAAFTRKKQAFHDLVSRCTVNFAFPENRILEGDI